MALAALLGGCLGGQGDGGPARGSGEQEDGCRFHLWVENGFGNATEVQVDLWGGAKLLWRSNVTLAEGAVVDAGELGPATGRCGAGYYVVARGEARHWYSMTEPCGEHGGFDVRVVARQPRFEGTLRCWEPPVMGP